MKLTSLNDLLVHQLQDLYGAEHQLLKAMPKMISTAKSPKLKKALETHMAETENQITRLEKVFESMDLKAKSIKCKAMEGLLNEAEEMLSENADAEVMDAGIIASAQRVEHYEIAGYGTASTYAKYLGHKEALQLLLETLNEEKKTDELLTVIAESSVNIKAENH